MKRIVQTLLRYLRVYGHMVKNSLMQQMEYRANFLMSIFMECLFLCTKLMYALLVYAQNGVGGVSPDEMLLYTGTFVLLTGLYTGIFMDNFYAVSGRVKRGELDLLLTKPLSSQFYITMNRVNMALPIPNLITGTTLVCIAWKRLALPAGAGDIALYILLLLLCLMMAYSVFLLPQLLCFKLVQMTAVIELSDKMWDFNFMPRKIYTPLMQSLGTYFIPVFMVTNFPVLAALRQMTWYEALWTACAPLALFILVHCLWKAAIRHYSSAGG